MITYIVHAKQFLLINCYSELFIAHVTQMVWIESPTNPMLKIVDIKAAAEIAHKNPVSVDSLITHKMSLSL